MNTWDRIFVERRIFTAAHELGHLVLHLGDYLKTDESILPLAGLHVGVLYVTSDTVAEEVQGLDSGECAMNDRALRRVWNSFVCELLA